MKSDVAGAVGRGIPGVDSRAKATGSLAFLQDIHLPGMLYAKMVFAGRPHARITDLSLELVRAAKDVLCLVTADDVPVWSSTTSRSLPVREYDTRVIV
jgi:CO/xanthine dehydrogenase Mo-binding subunit